MQPAGSNDKHNSPTIVSLVVCQGQVQLLAGPASPACRDLLISRVSPATSHQNRCLSAVLSLPAQCSTGAFVS